MLGALAGVSFLPSFKDNLSDVATGKPFAFARYSMPPGYDLMHLGVQPGGNIQTGQGQEVVGTNPSRGNL